MYTLIGTSLLLVTGCAGCSTTSNATPPSEPTVIERTEEIHTEPEAVTEEVSKEEPLAEKKEKPKAEPAKQPEPPREEPKAEKEPKTEPVKQTEPPKEEPVAVKKEEPKAETSKQPESPKEEPKAEEKNPEPVKEQPKQEPKPQISETEKKKNEEYTRSVGTVEVPKEVFEEDKKQILLIIDELSAVMKTKNYKKWLSYLDESSIRYYSKQSNLNKAAARLPVKNMQIEDLEAYFKLVFIPARTGRAVDEIRYESDTKVKAVQVTGDKDAVYYNFIKVNGVWKLHLPVISD